MFNGCNETPLISYNEFGQERGVKKQENVPKWSYGHGAGGQPTQPHSNGRQAGFWSGKPNFLGIPNVLKCSCAGCYPSSENQSYQSDSSRHRPWLPRTFSVPPNGSNEPCKLPMYQWDNGLSNQGSCYPEGNLPYVQENGGKYAYYRRCQNPRLPEPNQPGVITSAKNGDYAKKPKNEIPSPIQSGGRQQPVLCNPAYNLSKRVDGRNYCDPNEKYSNVVSYSVDQQVPRLPVVEPFIKAVPSNLSQNRVPSTGYRSVKENMSQQYVNSGYGDARKMTEPVVNGDKRCEAFPVAELQGSLRFDYSYLNRDLSEMETQNRFFDNTRHSDFYSKNNFQDVIKRNGQKLDNIKDCSLNQMGMSDQHYNMSRSKCQEVTISKPSYDVFYSKDFDKSRQENHPSEDSRCFKRNEDASTENSSFRGRLSRPASLFNEPNFATERTQNSFSYQSNQVAFGNGFRAEYNQGYNAQSRHKYPSDFQNLNQYRTTAQETQSCEQFASQQGNNFIYDVHYHQNVDKTQQFYEGKNQTSVQTDSQPVENRKPTYLEAVRSDEVNKNGTNKISPLRLLRKKKFVNVPQEPASVSTFDATNPGLDVRKFWSTWAEVEEETVAATQMVVLDCQNIDPEQAKLLHLYEADPVRAVHLESGGVLIKNAVKEPIGQTMEETKATEELTGEAEVEPEANVSKEVGVAEDGNSKKADEGNLAPFSESEKMSNLESICRKPPPSTPAEKEKPEQENRGKKTTEILDKWTEKKFDFLKRAEESKAAEMLRQEEEKKKIFETRLSLQQSFKKMEKCQGQVEESVSEINSPFSEYCESDSPEDGNARSSDLPTSEYRRNKFLDYSETKVVGNGKGEAERSEKVDERTEADQAEKVENVRPVCPRKWTDGQETEKFKVKLKEEPAFEMYHIMKKMSEINFQNSEVKNGLESDDTKNPRGPPTGKLKKKKVDLQSENEDRADKIFVETVSKPTIKFSIQKSHDLKISFKVLNGKEYSEEESGDRDRAEVKGNVSEDSNKSTELITLKYKSIQRDGDRKQNLDLKKNQRAFGRKKQSSRTKTPVLKLKKLRYAAIEERDPLANDLESLNVPDEYSTSNDFQVKETVDSAKIKLTFRRHKGNFETEYKINSNNVERVPGLDPLRQEHDNRSKTTKTRCRKKSRTKKSEIFAEPGVETFQESIADVDSEPEKIFLEDSRNTLTSEDCHMGGENFELEPALSTFEFPSDAPIAGPSPESAFSPSGEGERRYVTENSKSSAETNKCRPERGEFTVNHLISRDNKSQEKRHQFSTVEKDSFSDVSTKGARSSEESLEETEQFEVDVEKIQISPDVDKSTKSQEIESNHESRKTEERDDVKNGPETIEGENWSSGNSEKYNASNTVDGEDHGKIFALEISEIPRNWEVGSEATVAVCKPNELRIKANALPEIVPPVNFENEDENGKNISTDDHGKAVNSWATKPLIVSEKRTELHISENNVKRESDRAPYEDPNEGKAFESAHNVSDSVGNHAKRDFPNPEKSSVSKEQSLTEFLPAGEGCKEVAVEEQEESSIALQKCPRHLEFEGGLLKFGEGTERNHVDLAEPESVEIVANNFRGKYFPAFSPPEKVERPDVSLQVEPFSEEEGRDTKNGDDGLPNGCFLALKNPKDAEEAVSADDRLGREKTSKCGTVGEASEPQTAFTDSCSTSTETLEKGSRRFCGFSPDGPAQVDFVPDVAVASDRCADLESRLDSELEEGEIVDSSDERAEDFDDDNPQRSFGKTGDALRKVGFLGGEVERRHSMNSEKWGKTAEVGTWRRKFSKTKSCPPELKYPEGSLVREEPNFLVEDIPLPVGPPPLNSCLNIRKYMNSSDNAEAQIVRRESVYSERRPGDRKEISLGGSRSPSGLTALQTFPNSSPPTFVKELPSHSGIFPRSSKIKFSFSKRSKISKIDLNKITDSKVETAFDTRSGGVGDESGKRAVDSPDFEKNKKIRTPEFEGRSSQYDGCKTEDVPREEEKSLADREDKRISDSERAGDELDEPVEDVPDFIGDEFYECECIPASESLANGDDLELEKVNDDKFRNIMQNCIDNAKKFLGIGNLKLFSCSVDDLSELDGRTTSGGNELEKPTDHIVRDVLLTACDDDANYELGSPEDCQFSDFAVDLGSSLSTDVCPEILPVDNWPYLEEEVPSSPTTPKEGESDLISPAEQASSVAPEDRYPLDEAGFGSFRRRSVVPGEESFKPCSKICSRRRNTIDCFRSFGKNLLGIKSEIMRLKREPNEFEKTLKCRLSLKKLSCKRGQDCGLQNGNMKEFSEESENGVKVIRAEKVDYKSPSWQPKVMLFRISKNELRKILKSSKAYKKFKSKTSGTSQEVETPDVVLKKRKSDFHGEKGHVNLVEEIKKVEETLDAGSDETFISLTPLSSSFIKGSLKSTDPNIKKRKSRFRNLHTKRKIECGAKHSQTGQTRTSNFAEALLTKTFKDCGRISHSEAENPKDWRSVKEDEEKSKKRPDCNPQNLNCNKDKRPEKDPETLSSYEKSRENRAREKEKNDKRHFRTDRGERRREIREHRRQRDKYGVGASHDRSTRGKESPGEARHGRRDPDLKEEERSRTAASGDREKTKTAKEVGVGVPWICEVCGFDDATERVVHIKSHPFHCQSCHLAFKTEAHFIDHLTKKHKDIRNQHHCLLCELSFDTEEQYQKHLDTREHRHLEAVEKNTINTLFTLLTGAPCPVLGVVEMKPEWLPNQAGTVHFYHQATPLSLALQYLKMHHDLSSSASSAHPS